MRLGGQRVLDVRQFHRAICNDIPALRECGTGLSSTWRGGAVSSSFAGVEFSGACWRVAVVSAGQRENNDNAGEGYWSDDEDAAFGAGGSAAEDEPAYRVRGKQMVLDHGSAVGDAVEKGLCPVP